jgi:hypothetical protein
MKLRSIFAWTLALSALFAATSQAQSTYTYRIPVPGLAVTSAGTSGSGGSSGSGTGTASAQASPTYLYFSQTYVGQTSAAQAVTITNTGTADLGISGMSTGTSSFTQTNNCPSSLAPGASCVAEVSFVPQAAGFVTDNLTVQMSIGAGSITLTGSGAVACAAQTQSFTSPGTYSVTIPAGCQNLSYTVNGAGGGGYWDPSNGQHVGAGGVQVTGTTSTTGGDTYTVVVGAPAANLCYSSFSANAASNGGLSNFSLNSAGLVAQGPGGEGASASSNGVVQTNALGGAGGAPTGYGTPCPGAAAQSGSVTLSWN